MCFNFGTYFCNANKITFLLLFFPPIEMHFAYFSGNDTNSLLPLLVLKNIYICPSWLLRKSVTNPVCRGTHSFKSTFNT